MPRTDRNPVIFFDGVCNLCNGAVQFVLRRDHHGIFRFASLQSGLGESTMTRFGLDPKKIHSILLLEDDAIYQRSDAVIRIAVRLRGYSFLRIFKIVPTFLRDGLYDLISRNRYRIFGKRDECMLPSSEFKNRFIDGNE